MSQRRRIRLGILPLLLPLAACIPGPRPDPSVRATAALPTPDAQVPMKREDGVELPATAPPPFKRSAIAQNAVETRAMVYTVAPGDTLRRISDKTGAGSEAIARENGLEQPFTIRVGQKLRIPAGRWHMVRAGETGIAIARAYGADWSKIVAVNALEEPYILRTGQRLLLPTATQVANMSIEDRAAAFRLDIGDLITGSEPALAANQQPTKPVKTTPLKKALPPTIAVAASGRFDGRFDWPLTGPLLTRFGPFGSGQRNEGINIAAPLDTPVLAAADGVVLYAGTDISVYGGLILIRHSNVWTTAYGHAGELLVTRGQAVKRGQIIARAGESGTVSTPQLHFEIRQGRKPVDPLTLLPRRS